MFCWHPDAGNALPYWTPLHETTFVQSFYFAASLLAHINSWDPTAFCHELTVLSKVQWKFIFRMKRNKFTAFSSSLLSPFYVFHFWRDTLHLQPPPFPHQPCSLLSHALVCSVCHTGAKSSFHAIKRSQWLSQQQQQQPSVGDREGNHSIKPDGGKKKKTSWENTTGTKTTRIKTESENQTMHFLFHKVKHKYWIIERVHSRYSWI